MRERLSRVHVIISEPWDFQTENPDPYRNGLLTVVNEKYAIVDFVEHYRVGDTRHDAMVCISRQTDAGFRGGLLRFYLQTRIARPLDCGYGPL